MFAKLYGNDDDQILVLFEPGQSEQPSVTVAFQPQGMRVCRSVMTFPPTEDGNARAKQAFLDMTEETARARVRPRDRSVSEIADDQSGTVESSQFPILVSGQKFLLMIAAALLAMLVLAILMLRSLPLWERFVVWLAVALLMTLLCRPLITKQWSRRYKR